MHQFLISAAAFIVLVGVIVVLHELGHFIVAKLCGVRVEAFSFGFGPRLFGFKYGDTDYKVCLLPLGGFVKMAGEAAEQNLEVGGAQPAAQTDPASDPGSLLAKPRWQRMLIGLAGPTVNLLLALVLMFVYYALFNEVPSVTVNTTTVEWVTPGSAAATAGLQTGDTILAFDGVNHPDWETVYERSKLNANQIVPVQVQRGGSAISLSLHVPSSAKSDTFDLSDMGVSPQFLPGPIEVAQVQPDSVAEHAGLRDGDHIAAVDGHAFHSTNTLLAYMQWEKGKPLTLEVERNGATLQLAATPTETDGTWRLGFTWQPVPVRDQPLPFFAAWDKSFGFFKSNSLLVAEVLDRLFTHRLSMSQLMGPVGIAKAAGEAAQMDGWMPKFGLASEISLQLGILNLLPFPILDGGMILLLLIESALRHDISLVIKERIYTAAFVVLMAFFAFVLFNDVSRLGLFTHVKP
ncbi:MAG: RIP metalloprotease RseP [Terracidiphilus sp.]|jgi:regulator of sigma E protease